MTARTGSSGRFVPSAFPSGSCRPTPCWRRSALPIGGRPLRSAELDKGLTEALGRLDRRLAHALSAAEAASGSTLESDPFRGLHLDAADVLSALARGPLGPPFALPETTPIAPAGTAPFDHLAGTFGLDGFQLDLIVLALAPELDARYGRLFGFLQDDVTRRRPTVDLALTLLCGSRPERLERLGNLAGAGDPGSGLLRLTDRELPLASRSITPTPQLTHYALGGPAADGPLPAGCGWDTAAGADRELLPEDCASALERVARGTPAPTVVVRTPDRLLARAAARALAAARGSGLLLCPTTEPEAVAEAERSARLNGGLLFIDGHDQPARVAAAPWVQRVEPGTRAPRADLELSLPEPDTAARRVAWSQALEAVEVECEAGTLDALADRYPLDLEQIGHAADAARGLARYEGPRPRRPRERHLFAAARARSDPELERLSRRIEPCFGWDDIVLPAGTSEVLREIAERVRLRRVVHDSWGYGRKLARARGVTALFGGPSGSGKTMAAEVLAGELDLDLFRVDLSAVVSKYIGETEKNLARIFAAAERACAVLFFDEADALFGKRSEVRDSHDRYANVEIAYLLQEMEAYRGLAILATNLVDNLDDAFARRLSFTVLFPLPDADERTEIWRRVLPAELPVQDDVDVDALAREFELSGGSIRNAGLAAAFLAASDGGSVTPAHLRRAVEREYAKFGAIAPPPVEAR